MTQPANPTNPNPNKEEVERLAGEMEAEGPPKKGDKAVSRPATDPNSLKVHTTVPIDKSMAKIKAHRKPRKTQKDGSEVDNGKQDQNNGSKVGTGRNDGRTSSDAGSRGERWTILPVDWFRKS